MNHRDIFLRAGFDCVDPYPYHIDAKGSLEFDKLLRKLQTVANPTQTVLVLHASAHNPTGVDMSKTQWRKIKEVCHERGILPFFDCAYQVGTSAKR